MAATKHLFTGIVCLAGWLCLAAVPDAGKIITVKGPVEPEALGRMLSHEHVLVDFDGAAVASPDRYDQAEVVALVLPFLADLREKGFRSFVECTPDGLGRDVLLLRELSDKSGLHLLTNTGYYPLRKGKHVPGHGLRESANELAARWTAESRNGIRGTGIRPGFIKIAVSNAPLPELDQRIIRAAARTHLKTGLTIAMHTGTGRESVSRAKAGMRALEILREEGVSPRALIWVHAQASVGSWDTLLQAAELGAWISFDGASNNNRAEQHVRWLLDMESAGYLDQLLVSHDNGWYRVGEENSPESFKPYTIISDVVIPKLLQAGWSMERIDRLLVENPRRAFTVSVRRSKPGL